MAKKSAVEEVGIKLGDKFETGKRKIKTFQVDRVSKGGRVVYDERTGKGWRAKVMRVSTLSTWRKVKEFTVQTATK